MHLVNLIVLALLAQAKHSNGEIRCYDCSGISNPYSCLSIRRCRDNERCLIRAYVNDAKEIMYDLGCESIGFCSVLPKTSYAQDREILDMTYARLQLTAQDELSTSIVGLQDDFDKSMGYEKQFLIQKRQYEIPLCTKCCDNDHCNIDLCQSSLISRPPGLRCYDCAFATFRDPALCLRTRICGSNEQCHVKQIISLTGIEYQVDCESAQSCSDTGSSVPFGKRSVSDLDTTSEENLDEFQMSRRAFQPPCYTCCDVDYCNIDYCSNVRPLPANLTTIATTAATTTMVSPSSTTAQRLSLLFVQSPKDVEREANTAPVQYVCQVDGLPAPTYQWIRSPNDTDITSKALLSADGKASVLEFDPVLPEDEGDYICVASNQFESINRTGSLSVWAPLTLIAAPLKDMEVAEGSNLTLDCEHTGYPTPEYTWTISLPSGDNDTAFGQQYVINNISRADSGVYSCLAYNSRENNSQVADIEVLYSPEFTSDLPDFINVTTGANLTLQCSVDSKPPSTWSFIFYDENDFPKILPNVETSTNSDTLFIPRMDDTYAGKFTCFARNNVGIISHTVEVKVLP